MDGDHHAGAELPLGLYRWMIESASDFAVIATDLNGRVTAWSAGAEHVLGWTKTEMAGQAVDRIFTPEDRLLARPAIEMGNALETGVGNDERWHVKKDGSRFWANGQMTPLRTDGGDVIGFVKVLRDRTEQRAAAEREHADAEFLSSILRSSGDCIKVLDLEGKLLSMNESALQLMEISDFNAIRGCYWPQFWEGDGNERARAALDEARAGRAARFSGKADTMAGASRWWDVQATPILGTDGRPQKLLVVSRDVTDTLAAASAVRDSEERWRGLFGRLQEGFILGELIRDDTGAVTDWRYLDVNPAWGRLVGVEPQAAIGRTIRQVFPGIEDSWIQEVAEVVARGGSATFIRQVGALARWYEGRAFALQDDRFGILFLEVTDRIHADERRAALEALGDRLDAATQLGDMAYAAAEVLGRTLGVAAAGYGRLDLEDESLTVERDWAEPGFTSLAGRHHLRDFGSFVDDLRKGETVAIDDVLVDPRTRPQADALLAIRVRALVNLPVMEGGRAVASFYVGSCQPTEWSAEVLSFVGTVAQRTRSAIERRRAEQDLQDLAASLEQHIEQRTAELMRAEEQLRQSQKLEAVGQLTGGVAHDFNNLLTIIRSSVDFLKREDLTSARRSRYVEAISDTVDRAAKLTSQLLAFARRQPLKPQVFDVGARLREVSELIRPLVGARICIEVEVCDKPCHVEADVSQFETALLNLAVNARDAMEGEGRLVFAVREVAAVPAIRGHLGVSGDFLAVSVSDTGRGIEPDQIASIFEPFYTTKEVGKGTGLGLSQVFGFTKQSGGEVDVSSEPLGGAVFTIYLPRATSTAPPNAPAEPTLVAATPQGLCVLVVEDNETVGRFADEMLRDLGYRTHLVGNAAEALAALNIGHADFDVVFSDVIMPGMNGVELAREIRRRRPELPVVLTSGYSNVLAQEGAQGFELLRKPYSVAELSQVLSRVAGPKPNALENMR